MLDPHVHLHGIPAWVWAALVVALFVFGMLYFVPETGQEVGRIFTGRKSPSAAIHSNGGPFHMEPFATMSDAREACGKDNIDPWSFGADSYKCVRPFKAQ